MWEYLRTVMARSYWHGAAQRYTEDLHLQRYSVLHLRLLHGEFRAFLEIAPHEAPCWLDRHEHHLHCDFLFIVSHTCGTVGTYLGAPHDAYELRTAAPRGSGGHHPGLQRQTAC
jgi:hypothetical protein